MRKIKNLSLQFSCTEKLSDNLFCSKCSRQLIDFTNKTEKELKFILDNSNSKICGLFKKSQLSTKFLKYTVVTVIATSAMTITVYGQKPINADSLAKTYEIVKASNEEEVIFGMPIETMATPVGGYIAFYEKLTSMIKYPDGLATKGKVFLEFTIDTLGQMQDVKIVKGFNELADKEALRVVMTINFPFKPGKQGGKPIKSKLYIPIIFDPEKYK